ncbi:MAG: DUF6783 domain-containing protein [Blautia wexlerae]
MQIAGMIFQTRSST